MIGPDRVLTQCFPVPPGGTMKIRLGITTLLQSQQALFMPQIIERNFTIHENAKHALWIQSRSPLLGGDGYPSAAGSQDGSWVWQADVPQPELGRLVFRIQKPPLPKVWTRDKLALSDELPIVVAERIPRSVVAVGEEKPLLIVLDGSASLRQHAELLGVVLRKLIAQHPKLAVWVSHDTGMERVPSAELTAGLSAARFAGGRDSASAILAALQHMRSAGMADASLHWLH
jgi:hypothetical protein